MPWECSRRYTCQYFGNCIKLQPGLHKFTYHFIYLAMLHTAQTLLRDSSIVLPSIAMLLSIGESASLR